jgi:hypothetical protein
VWQRKKANTQKLTTWYKRKWAQLTLEDCLIWTFIFLPVRFWLYPDTGCWILEASYFPSWKRTDKKPASLACLLPTQELRGPTIWSNLFSFSSFFLFPFYSPQDRPAKMRYNKYDRQVLVKELLILRYLHDCESLGSFSMVVK